MIAEGPNNLIIVKVWGRWLYDLELGWRLLAGHLVYSVYGRGQTCNPINIAFLLFRLLLLLLLESCELSVVDAFAVGELLVQNSYVLLPFVHPDVIQNEWVVH